MHQHVDLDVPIAAIDASLQHLDTFAGSLLFEEQFEINVVRALHQYLIA